MHWVEPLKIHDLLLSVLGPARHDELLLWPFDRGCEVDLNFKLTLSYKGSRMLECLSNPYSSVKTVYVGRSEWGLDV